MSETIKIAYIGGGSRHWAPVMMQDLALTEGLDGELTLYDLAFERAEANAALGRRIFGLPEAASQFSVRACPDRGDCLRDTDVVFVSILPGPMTCFGHDLDIPLKHGVLQTVGDTVGPGGLSRCLRTVPIFSDIARAIAEHCPDAWVINYTNPMTVATQALTAEVPTLKTLGCCHEVFACRSWIGGMAAQHYGIPLNHRNEVDVEVVGLNHFTFFSQARYHGHDVWPAIAAWIDKQGDFWRDRTEDALAREAKGRYGSCDGLIQLDFWRRFGVFGAAGDRHLVEFVPWYCDTVDHLRRWGVSVTSSQQRLGDWKPDNVDYVPPTVETLKRSKEEGIDLVAALVGVKPLVTNVNVPNRGQIPWLPEGHVVETLGAVTRDSIEEQSKPAFFTAPGHVDQLDAACVALDARYAGDEEGLVLKEVEMSPPFLRGIVHGAVLATAGRAGEPASAAEVQVDVDLALGLIEIDGGDGPRRDKA